MWKNTYDAGQRYLDKYPRLMKWMNQCVSCQAIGYKPEMPDSAESHRELRLKQTPSEGAEFMNIRYRFKCLPLNEHGLCDVCQGTK